MKNYIMIARNLSSTKEKIVEKELTDFITADHFISLNQGKWLLKTELSADEISNKLNEVINFSEELIIIALAEDFYVRVKDSKIEGWFSSRFEI